MSYETPIERATRYLIPEDSPESFSTYNQRAEKAAVSNVAELLQLETIFHSDLTASEARGRLYMIFNEGWITSQQYYACIHILNGVLTG